MIYENIDKGIYDLSSEKSGIRVGNESYQVSSGGAGASAMSGTGGKKLEANASGSGGSRHSNSTGSSFCCGSQ